MAPTRRDMLSAMAAAAAPLPAGNRWSASGLKLGVSHQSPKMLNPAHFQYLKQMGVEYLEVRIPAAQSGYEELVRIKRTVEEAGLKLFEIMLSDTFFMPQASIAGPGRDQEIATFQRFIRDLGKAGIDSTTYCWFWAGVYQSGTIESRGCESRLFELEQALKRPNVVDREYSDDEMWANYDYWLRRVLPVAEEARVRLQLHPNDPPVTHAGVARIFRNRDGFRRAMQMAKHSPYSGLLFCTGCWGEMCRADGKPEDVLGAIREFGSRGQIFQVHFRNVSATLPNFHETFPDNGYMNMYRIMKALGEVKFNGIVVPDHVPRCPNSESGPRAGEAYIFGYLRAMIQAVETELGRSAI